MNMTALTPPAPSGSDRPFLDEAVASHAERLGRKEANRHKRNDLLAALVLALALAQSETRPDELGGGSKVSVYHGCHLRLLTCAGQGFTLKARQPNLPMADDDAEESRTVEPTKLTLAHQLREIRASAKQ